MINKHGGEMPGAKGVLRICLEKQHLWLYVD